MNICLLFVCMTVLPVIIGVGVLAVLYRRQARQFYMADALITGWLVVIGLAEVAHLAAVFLGFALSRATILWVAAVLSVTCVCGVVGLYSAKRDKKNEKPVGKGVPFSGKQVTPLRFALVLSLALMVGWQIMTIVSDCSVYRTGDMTVETVETFLKADAVHAINPLTGRAYEAGIPLRIRILCLPTLYGSLCELFGLEGVTLVWKCVPLVVLLLSYSAFLALSRALFERREDREKRLLFMVLTALVICVGDYGFGMDGFGLLHCGFMGVTIRNMVLVPYTLALMLRGKVRPVVLLVLAEACITWTLYGMGVCLAVAAVIALLRICMYKKTAGLHVVGREA